MAWQFHFRKTFGGKFFRTTISKSGVTNSIGIPGLRLSASSNGTKRVTTGIPGTGIYWTSESKSRRNDKRK